MIPTHICKKSPGFWDHCLGAQKGESLGPRLFRRPPGADALPGAAGDRSVQTQSDREGSSQGGIRPVGSGPSRLTPRGTGEVAWVIVPCPPVP